MAKGLTLLPKCKHDWVLIGSKTTESEGHVFVTRKWLCKKCNKIVERLYDESEK